MKKKGVAPDESWGRPRTQQGLVEGLLNDEWEASMLDRWWRNSVARRARTGDPWSDLRSSQGHLVDLPGW